MPDLPPLSAATRLCAVYGFPVRHSASPAMHNAALAHLGLDWRYVAAAVHPDHLPAALAGARAMRFIGLNLTVPHKLLAVPLMDALDDSARRWGAVNTVRFEGRAPGGAWLPLARPETDEAAELRAVGFNTDADAIVRSLGEDLGFTARGARLVLLGAGGAGRVAALRLAAEEPAALHLVNRTAARAAEVAEEIVRRHPALAGRVSAGYPAGGEVDLVLNATSAGLRAEDPLPFDPAALDLRRARAAYDMIYRPAETPFLRAARAAGCRTANGLGMLLHQGAGALEIWSGRPAPRDVMRAALAAAVYGPPPR